MKESTKLLLLLANFLITITAFISETFMFMYGWDWFIAHSFLNAPEATFWVTAGIITMLSYLTAQKSDKALWETMEFRNTFKQLREEDRLTNNLMISSMKLGGVILIFLVLFIIHLFV